MIKIGLIGAGFMGSMHASCYEALAERYDFRITAVADDDPEKAANIAAKFGAAVYPSGAALIAEGDVDTVDICLPTYLHFEAASEAVKKGYNAFIEKPVCLNESEADRLLALQRETGANVMVGQCIRFWPEYRELARLVRDNAYGPVRSGVFRRISPRPGWAWRDWLHEADKSGSAALDLHVHDVDFVRSLFGEPDSLKAEIVRQDGLNAHIFSLYRYGDAVVTLEGGWDNPENFPFEMAYRVRFERATAVFSSASQPTLRIYENGGAVVEPAMDGFAGAADGPEGGNISSLGGYYNELAYFLDCLTAGRPIRESTLQDGCDSLRLTLRAVASA
ncbi:Gfo/Idh/MocA family protein [Paenibacillus flagellatus]|uniref:Gfo/Idh/MocA family oxidoreductase n=1 Tax=Paenibacillus flagellatus TaxID=2211139 RepID=A0A2V5KA51_9BACL|nr:Gfo/Idh/MocA family oxidoreductase [Paenibacillus flagellatus]PYI56439.1 gfo/Idh/MocA family oxidoreductase [Paenibacillus flagellatus]